MSQEKTHDLHDFMRQLQDRMAAHYKQIQKRASEDPGTAGDQGEENWRDLLSGWLPRTYEVFTKGRIIGQDGRISPQVDVLVLKNIYPKQLINEGQKIFLAAGVAAAFECKTTLTAAHIVEAMETCVKIKDLYPVRKGTPYNELHAPIVYGLLAHSHSWKRENSTPKENIEQKLREADYLRVSHPRLGLDLLCVADLGTWFSSKVAFVAPRFPGTVVYPDGAVFSAYQGRLTARNQIEHFRPIGAFISSLSKKLAWETPELRDLVDYYKETKIEGLGYGEVRQWPSSIYSEEVRQRVKTGDLSLDDSWDEWNFIF